MNKKHVKWLYGELPQLIKQGVLSSEEAKRITDYYGESHEKGKQNLVFSIFGTLGAISIALGIILLLAFNWSDLSRSARTVLSFLPLLIGQFLSGWVIINRKESLGWCEGASSFLMIAIGSSISLISQTYHIAGDFKSFLLVWMLLSIPLVYLFKASVPSILYMIGITVWATASQFAGGNGVLFWGLILLVLPHIVLNIREGLHTSRSVFLLWSIAIILCIALGITLEKIVPGLWIITYAGYFATLYLLGKMFYDDDIGFWQKPFSVVGGGGILVMSYLLTYVEFWENIGWNSYRNRYDFSRFAGIFDYVICGGFLLSSLYLFVIFLKKKEKNSLAFGAMSVIASIGYFLAASVNPYIGVIIFNLYLLGVGIITTVYGINKCRMGITNGGMIITSLLIFLRFFDSNLGFILRGTLFILIGVGFLVSNRLLIKRQRGMSNG
ncbi:DUF2157 domain-containing protein [Natronincola ferrireducens]|uniref:Predicted membrane protein n=1 Tax=Natronincola ferrireducens TaxID=393762 RepID=A0A1G9GM32_9FIRM|nr:DUF2157 domain-containing protein [Natronincola ferrireducens]SDL01750.1 Predicted membrane protein [Natronincola ferrireducens]